MTIGFGSKWADIFADLEVHHGLDVHNECHIWLIHYLFLTTINEEADFWVDTWNHHRIQIRDGPNRSPIDMFGFDMLVHGFRGDDLQESDVEAYGVDWDALRVRPAEGARPSMDPRDTHEPEMSWVGRTGPPETLSSVVVDEPVGPLSTTEISALDNWVFSRFANTDRQSLTSRWQAGLAYARTISPQF